MTRIAILDYGMGNLRSVGKALEHVGAEPFLTSDHARVREGDGVVLHGVGAMPKAMERVRELALDQLLRERVEASVPVIGGQERVGANVFERLAHRSQVPHAVVEDRDARQRTPLVEGTPSTRSSRSTAARSARANALNDTSTMW